MGLTYTDLAREVAHTLELPFRERKGEAYSIVKAVFQAMAEKLQAGESIYVYGLGRFIVRTKPPKPRQRILFLEMGRRRETFIKIPAKRYVWFKPDQSITRTLNASKHTT